MPTKPIQSYDDRNRPVTLGGRAQALAAVARHCAGIHRHAQHEPQADLATEPQADLATEPQADLATEPQADLATEAILEEQHYGDGEEGGGATKERGREGN